MRRINDANKELAEQRQELAEQRQELAQLQDVSETGRPGQRGRDGWVEGPAGRGSFELAMSHYEEAPPQEVLRVIAASKEDA